MTEQEKPMNSNFDYLLEEGKKFDNSLDFFKKHNSAEFSDKRESVFAEVQAKLDYCRSRKEAGESGYDPAIDLYDRILTAFREMKQMIIDADFSLIKEEDGVIVHTCFTHPNFKES